MAGWFDRKKREPTMNRFRHNNLSFMIPVLLSILFTQGCVAQKQTLSQSSKEQTLAEQLKNERQKHGQLKKETAHLKKRIEDLETELTLTKENAASVEKNLREQLIMREKQREIAMDMGAFIERSLSGEIDRLNKELEKLKPPIHPPEAPQ